MDTSNPIKTMRDFFAKGSREVSLAEFTSFWKSLNEDEKNEYRAHILLWDGVSEFITEVKPHLALPPAMVVATA